MKTLTYKKKSQRFPYKLKYAIIHIKLLALYYANRSICVYLYCLFKENIWGWRGGINEN